MLSEILIAFGTLFPIVNPISTSFTFDNLTKHFSAARRRHTAVIASITAATILLLFLILGSVILDFFGITIYAFRVAGGLYLGKVAFSMLSQHTYKTAHPRESSDAIGVMPCGTPLLAGPGSMAAVLVLSENKGLPGYLAIAFAIILIAIVAFIFFSSAHTVMRRFGQTGADVVERILGLLVLVVAAQFVFNGISGYLTSLGF